MRVQKNLQIGSGVLVKELTVGEIRALLITAHNGPSDADLRSSAEERSRMEMNNWLLPVPTLTDVLAMTDLDEAGMDLLTQSELTEVVDSMRELNPLFFGMKGRIHQAKMTTDMAKLLITPPSNSVD